MSHRWFLRALFLLPLLVCLLGWCWSVGRCTSIAYGRFAGPFLEFGTSNGTVLLSAGPAGRAYRWHCEISTTREIYFWPHPWWGFSWYHLVLPVGWSGDRFDCYILGIPYWFLLLLFALILLFVWRKTGQAPKPGGAFPVELSKPQTPNPKLPPPP